MKKHKIILYIALVTATVGLFSSLFVRIDCMGKEDPVFEFLSWAMIPISLGLYLIGSHYAKKNA